MTSVQRENPIGYEWLRLHYGLSVVELNDKSYTGGLIGTQGADHRNTHNLRLRNFRVGRPENEDPIGHAVFALKREGIAIGYFRALASLDDFRSRLETAVGEKPTSGFLRKAWFLCEWLSGELLALPDCKPVPYQTLLDPNLYYVGPIRTSTRHRLHNNIVGTSDFTVTVRCDVIEASHDPLELAPIVQAVTQQWDPEMIARASRYLVSQETRSSGEIEQESFSKGKAIRFSEALLLAGETALTKDHLIRVQALIKERGPETDYRAEQNWIGGRANSIALPTARPEYVELLMASWFDMYKVLCDSDVPPSIQAAMLSGSFVYIHPFMDGNGRLSRFIMQEALCRGKITQPGLVLPVSHGILSNIHDYYNTLNNVSERIERTTDYEYDDIYHQLEVLTVNDHLFRDLDLTEYALWLSKIIHDVANEGLQAELLELATADALTGKLDHELDMSSKEIRLLVTFIIQGNGRLSGKKRRKFPLLDSADFERIEQIIDEVYQQHDRLG